MQADRNKIFLTPLSPSYWQTAAAQLKNPKILCYAAMMIAVRVALKELRIPIGPDLSVYFGFFVNALGAMTFGPVVAVLAAAVSDTLGCALTGFAGYFFPFIFVEIIGSLIFALWLWRAKLSATRVILSRFFVVLICNFVMNPAIMNWYYAWINNGKTYKFVTLPRVIKNLALLPFESALLVLFLGAVSIPLIKLKFLPEGIGKPKLEKKHIILLAVLFALSAAFIVGYYFLWLPNK